MSIQFLEADLQSDDLFQVIKAKMFEKNGPVKIQIARTATFKLNQKVCGHCGIIFVIVYALLQIPEKLIDISDWAEKDSHVNRKTVFPRELAGWKVVSEKRVSDQNKRAKSENPLTQIQEEKLVIRIKTANSATDLSNNQADTAVEKQEKVLTETDQITISISDY